MSRSVNKIGVGVRAAVFSTGYMAATGPAVPQVETRQVTQWACDLAVGGLGESTGGIRPKTGKLLYRVRERNGVRAFLGWWLLVIVVT